jgi:hypothetical protein
MNSDLHDVMASSFSDQKMRLKESILLTPFLFSLIKLHRPCCRKRLQPGESIRVRMNLYQISSLFDSLLHSFDFFLDLPRSLFDIFQQSLAFFDLPIRTILSISSATIVELLRHSTTFLELCRPSEVVGIGLKESIPTAKRRRGLQVHPQRVGRDSPLGMSAPDRCLRLWNTLSVHPNS